MDEWINQFRSIQFYLHVTEQNNNCKRYQGYNDRFLKHSIKYSGTEWSLLLIEAEIFYENLKDGIAMALSVSDISHGA